MADTPQLLVKGTVQLGKPWWASKKIWIALLGLAAAIVTAYTGKTETTADLVVLVTKVASILGVVAPLVLAIAHVDKGERDVATAIIQQFKDLGAAGRRRDAGRAGQALRPGPGTHAGRMTDEERTV